MDGVGELEGDSDPTGAILVCDVGARVVEGSWYRKCAKIFRSRSLIRTCPTSRWARYSSRASGTNSVSEAVGGGRGLAVATTWAIAGIGGNAVAVVFGRDSSLSEDSESKLWTTQNYSLWSVSHRSIMRIFWSVVTLSGCMPRVRRMHMQRSINLNPRASSLM